MSLKLFFILLISFSVLDRCHGYDIEEEVKLIANKIQYAVLFGTAE
jgi:hypothetical protein